VLAEKEILLLENILIESIIREMFLYLIVFWNFISTAYKYDYIKARH
jgi:hypothetical protein